MELGWILILAGIAILAFLHFSGRSRGSRSMGQAASQSPLQEDALPQDPAEADPYGSPMSNASAGGYPPEQHGNNRAFSADPQASQSAHPGVQHDHLNPSGGYDPHTAGYPADYVNDPLMSPAGQQQPADHTMTDNVAMHQPPPADGASMGFDNMEPGDMQRPADVGLQDNSNYAPTMSAAQTQNANTGYDAQASQVQPPANAETSSTREASGFSNFLSNLSGGILGKRRGSGGFDPLSADGGMHPNNGAEPMVITLHVVAPEGQIIHGPRLQALFEQRGYHYGEMNIFHSLNQGNIVFSVAKIVEPGTFDINNPGSFETPGITLILQLPAPVAANVAFDVLVSEASEMAKALGCNLLDSGHSTLSRQTIQHLSDSVQQFMHRQRVAESVPS